MRAMPSMDNFGMPPQKSLNLCLVNFLLLEKLANTEGLASLMAALESTYNGFSEEVCVTRGRHLAHRLKSFLLYHGKQDAAA